jgi:hypothetical protein
MSSGLNCRGEEEEDEKSYGRREGKFWSNTHFKGCAAGSSVGKHHSNKQKIIIPINLDKKKFEKIIRIKNSGNSLE